MVSKVYSVALQGISAQLIEVETAASPGLRSFSIVGLGDKAIAEARERVNAAIKSIGLSPPHRQRKRVLVNLAPADLKKEGSLYDLPIALSYLQAAEQTKFDPHQKIFLGELALDGKLKPSKGVFSFTALAQEQGFSEIIIPRGNEKEAQLACFLNPGKELKVVGAENLKQVIRYLEGREEIETEKIDFSQLKDSPNFEIDFNWIKGQSHAKRCLEIAAAGGHNLMLQGPPGAGKTLLAKSIISILPALNREELLELVKIYSAAGLFEPKRVLISRPFRSPHHCCSEAALIGGGNPIRPGEITLSHRGVLFLDEFPEFHRDVLESLRSPMEEGKITIQRAKENLTFPARFALIAAANPCPCGYHNDPEKECSCTNSQVASYHRKLSGPLMDRIDIFSWVPSLKYSELVSPDETKPSEEKRAEVERTREIQKQRFNTEAILTNSEMKVPQIKKYCQIDSSSNALLRKYIDSGKLSARGFHRILKVARTIADLAAEEKISQAALGEALNYRLIERS